MVRDSTYNPRAVEELAHTLTYDLEFDRKIERFVKESWKIEGLYPGTKDLGCIKGLHMRFLHLKEISVRDVVTFVRSIEPHAELRDKPGMNVFVGNYAPPLGGPRIAERLAQIIKRVNYRREAPRRAFELHHSYEGLHPFTDGNGRSGRVLWLWMMGDSGLDLPFLHRWYYQSLNFAKEL